MGNNKKHSVVGLFSGCGGLDLGFINSGYEVVWANDFFKDAVDTYKKKYWRPHSFGRYNRNSKFGNSK